MCNRVSSPNSFAIEVRSILGLDCPLLVLTSLQILGAFTICTENPVGMERLLWYRIFMVNDES